MRFNGISERADQRLVNFCQGIPQPKGSTIESLTDTEKHGLDRDDDFETYGNAYSKEHGTRPATIGLVSVGQAVLERLLECIGAQKNQSLVWSSVVSEKVIGSTRDCIRGRPDRDKCTQTKTERHYIGLRRMMPLASAKEMKRLRGGGKKRRWAKEWMHGAEKGGDSSVEVEVVKTGKPLKR